MKPTPHDDPWLRLAALARAANPTPASVVHEDPADDARFAENVLRRWAAQERGRTAVSSSSSSSPAGWVMPWESWGLRGLGAAVALTAAMLFWNLPLLNADTFPEDLLPPDPVAELTEAF